MHKKVTLIKSPNETAGETAIFFHFYFSITIFLHYNIEKQLKNGTLENAAIFLRHNFFFNERGFGNFVIQSILALYPNWR